MLSPSVGSSRLFYRESPTLSADPRQPEPPPRRAGPVPDMPIQQGRHFAEPGAPLSRSAPPRSRARRRKSSKRRRRSRPVLNAAALVVLLVLGGLGYQAAREDLSALAGPVTDPHAWPLTGVPVDAVPSRPALAVKIENSVDARPQTGLNAADLLWEEVVEGGITRFVAVYSSPSTSRTCHPRSARCGRSGRWTPPSPPRCTDCSPSPAACRPTSTPPRQRACRCSASRPASTASTARRTAKPRTTSTPPRRPSSPRPTPRTKPRPKPSSPTPRPARSPPQSRRGRRRTTSR